MLVVHSGVLDFQELLQSFVAVYFKSSIRNNPATNQYDGYYRLVESYRNIEGRVCHRTILNVGFIDNNITPGQLNKTQAYINERCHKQETLFSETDPVVITLTESLWMRLIQEKRIDIEKTSRQVDFDTIKHSNVREIGSEWMCYQSWNQLQLSEFLLSQGFSETQAQLASTQVISRAVYPASELKTTSWIQENSGVCELTGYEIQNLTKDKLYQSALALHRIAPALQTHLSQCTNTLFNLEDKIILYDLTNTYFEGSMRKSDIAKHGRSKEKRNDAKLIVLAMVINVEGFIKYTAIHQGNIADCNTLQQTIKKLDSSTELKSLSLYWMPE